MHVYMHTAAHRPVCDGHAIQALHVLLGVEVALPHEMGGNARRGGDVLDDILHGPRCLDFTWGTDGSGSVDIVLVL